MRSLYGKPAHISFTCDVVHDVRFVVQDLNVITKGVCGRVQTPHQEISCLGLGFMVKSALGELELELGFELG